MQQLESICLQIIDLVLQKHVIGEYKGRGKGKLRIFFNLMN